MSGGVDSSVAAWLLREQGYAVTALTMWNWSPAVPAQAARVACHLGLEHLVLDLRREFRQAVVDYFVRSYQEGLTPNPCVACNEQVKFGLLLEKALEVGCERVASGHYARTWWDEQRGRYLLARGRDRRKDQSYFLYRLRQEQLARLLLPLGDLTKEEVRQLAVQQRIPAAGGESQEVCFIAGDYRDFLREAGVRARPGDIVDGRGRVLGRHQGLPFYTVGQRRGLGVAAGQPLYVVELDVAGNRLVVGTEAELHRSCMVARANNFVAVAGLDGETEALVQVRYRARPAPALLKAHAETVEVCFRQGQRAICPGQSAVYYQEDLVLGGGIIERVCREGRDEAGGVGGSAD
jgi:tRNA-specific 2-thiouridylase